MVSSKNLVMTKLFPLLVISALFVGCSGGSGDDLIQEGNVQQEQEPGESVLVYNGPDAISEDVASFRVNVWDNLAGDDRCGACHNEVAGIAPQFLRRDNINDAYQTTLNTLFQGELLANLEVPSMSGMVLQAASGHNCWLDEPSVCADIITRYIEAWAAEGGQSNENVIVLTAPEEKEVGASLSFPEDSGVFATTIYPVVREEGDCADCHAEDGSRMRQQPYFASANVNTAYLAAQPRINLNDAAALRDPVQQGAPRPSSRLLVRLRDESHNCWEDPAGGDACAYSAGEMEQAIADFLNQIPPPAAIDEELQAVASRAVNLVQDGVVASSGGRFEADVVALYEFSFGSGNTAFDRSGVDPALNLTLSGDVTWLGSFGLRFAGGKAQGNTVDSAKLRNRIQRTGQYSIEAWVVPANVTQDGPARIVTYSGDGDNRNFTLGQTLYNYDFLSRSSEIDQSDQLSTPDADEILQATLQHVVVNFDPFEGRSIYVNGELIATDPTLGGNLNEWNDTYALALGSEVDNMDRWAGSIRLLAIHERTLTEEQILNNFETGVGQKFFLLFGVSHLVDMPQAYVVFEVEVFDDYSYLFTNPFFISLDRNAVPPAGGIQISGIRIGINGQEASIGQAFANVDTTINADNYNPDNGAVLASIGSVIASEQGQNADEFFLTFDTIGTNTYARPAPEVPVAAPPVIADQQSDFGTRIFGEINATMAKMTGVSANNTNVSQVYNSVIQQLPQVESVDAFLPSHQAGIMQLAVAYCTELVSNPGGYFGGASLNGTITSPAQADVFLEPLLENITAHEIEGSVLASSPVLTAGGDGVQELLAQMMVDFGDAEQATIAACTSLAGSAIMLMQ